MSAPTNVIERTPDYLLGLDKGHQVLVRVSARREGATNRDNISVLTGPRNEDGDVTGILREDGTVQPLGGGGATGGDPFEVAGAAASTDNDWIAGFASVRGGDDLTYQDPANTLEVLPLSEGGGVFITGGDARVIPGSVEIGGGNLYPPSDATFFNGGDVTISGGDVLPPEGGWPAGPYPTHEGGDVIIESGSGPGGGRVTIRGADAADLRGDGGEIRIEAGDGGPDGEDGEAGDVRIRSGWGYGTSGADIRLTAGGAEQHVNWDGVSPQGSYGGGDIFLTAGGGDGPEGVGGEIVLLPGAGSGTGASGGVVVSTPNQAQLQPSSTSGFAFWPTCNGAPTQPPETFGYTNCTPFVIDVVNWRFYAWDGAAWRYAQMV